MSDDIDDKYGALLRVQGGSDHGEIGYRPVGGRTVRVLCHGGTGERRLALHGEHVYWSDSDNGTITRIGTNAGIPVVLATDQRGVGPIAIADGWIYWGRGYAHGDDGLYRMPVEGGAPTRIADGQVEALAPRGDTVAWTTMGEWGADGRVLPTRISDGATVPVAIDQKQPRSVVLDDEALVWACYGEKRPRYFEDGSVVRASRARLDDRDVLASDRSMPRSLVLDGDSAYWCESQTTYGPGPSRAGGVRRWVRATGQVRSLCEWTEEDGVIAVDATHVYFLACFGGSMRRVPKEGGAPERLLAHRVDNPLRLWSVDLAVDDRFVYWTSHSGTHAGGALFQMAK